MGVAALELLPQAGRSSCRQSATGERLVSSGGRYLPTAVSTFLQVADYYLVSHAHAHGHTVVTHEVVDNAIKRIKIPNVCLGMGIPCINPFEMLRTKQARFVLPS